MLIYIKLILKSLDFEWGLFVFDGVILYIKKTVYSQTAQVGKYLRNTGKYCALALAKLLLTEQGLMHYRSIIHNHKLYSSAQW